MMLHMALLLAACDDAMLLRSCCDAALRRPAIVYQAASKHLYYTGTSPGLRARTIWWIDFSLRALWWIEFSLRALWWIRRRS
eukprot:COSAG01_NODE_1823_length_9143_cov_7.938640_3_plen_82_part_00